jgi:hypothetical protein
MAMAQVKTVAEWLAERGVGLAELIASSEMDERTVKAILQGRWTPSPEDRRRLSAALGVAPEQVAWGHLAQVEHMYGHGPQFGRSP